MFIEPVKDGDPFEVSDADTMLKYIDPKWEPHESVSIITKPGCPFCAKAKALLKEKGYAFEEIVLGRDAPSLPCARLPAKRLRHKCLSAVNTSAAATIWKPTSLKK